MSRQIIEESKEEMGKNNVKYVLPKDKSKEELQGEMEKTYYGHNDTLIFRNNYSIIPIGNDDDIIDKPDIDNIKLNFDEELKIDERYGELLLQMKEIDTSKDFYNFFTEQEINEKVQKIVAKVIPEESKNFKTSLPLFDALGAIEKTRSKYVSIVDKLNNINDVYEQWIEGTKKNIINSKFIFILFFFLKNYIISKYINYLIQKIIINLLLIINFMYF